jgi:glycosyltransferase involved in cell wall biosynthesis
MSQPARKPAVSVVVPCYNDGPFVDRLVATLAAQSFRNFEVIIVDDGSDEATRAKLATLDPSVRVIRQTNQGPGAARNTGFREAKADLVMPLDCDDEIAPEFLAVAVAAMKKSPDAAFVFSHLRLAGETHGTLERSFHPFDMLFSNGIPSCALIRKSVWDAIGGYDEVMRDGYEDWEFFLRIALHGYPAVEIPRPLFTYNMASDGLLLGRSSRAHVRLWRYMRQKHRDAYRLPSLVRLWWRTRDGTGKVSLARALVQLLLASVLPDALYGAMMTALRSHRFMRPAETRAAEHSAAARP